MVEVLAEYLNVQNGVIVLGIWGFIYLANSIAKATPNKADNRLVNAIRRIARTIGAEPPHPDVEEYDKDGKAVSKEAKGK